MKKLLKKVLKVGLVGLLALGLTAGIAIAATDDSAVTVTVGTIDLLDVTDGGPITLTGTAGSDDLTGADSDDALLNYTHNKATNMKITAVSDLPAGTHDITLTVAVAGGAGTLTIVTAGTLETAVVVYDEIEAGALSAKTVTYGASATASGTLASSYVFTVTFTSVDVS